MSSYSFYQIPVFWDNEYKTLDYHVVPFNNPADVNLWITQGYSGKIVGDLCDMERPQPSWNQQIIDYYASLGWQDIGTAYYRMTTGTVMPEHKDLYKKYISLHNLQGREHTIRRAVVFLEDWQSGHYLEIDQRPVTNWRAGQTVEWYYDTPHMAANLGLAPRYTLQITGHVDD